MMKETVHKTDSVGRGGARGRFEGVVLGSGRQEDLIGVSVDKNKLDES